MKKFQKLGFLLTFLILVGMFFIPPTEMLPIAARNTLGVLLAVIVLLVTEALPMSAVCLLSVSMLVIFGCAPSVPAALSGYTNQIVFFIIASFGISQALTQVPLSRRMLVKLMQVFGKGSKQLLFAIMLTTCLLSSIISNVAAAAVFLPIILKFLDVYEDEADRKATARCYMIGLPIASQIGGMMTPAGSSINMLAIIKTFDESYGKKNYVTIVDSAKQQFLGTEITYTVSVYLMVDDVPGSIMTECWKLSKSGPTKEPYKNYMTKVATAVIVVNDYNNVIVDFDLETVKN